MPRGWIVPRRFSTAAVLVSSAAFASGCGTTPATTTEGPSAGPRETASARAGTAAAITMRASAGSASLTPQIAPVKVSADDTRRGLEPDYVNSQKFGAPRGREFQDIIPIGARLTAIHTAGDERIGGIWLSYEIGGKVSQTPCRGRREGREQSVSLGKREKVVGIHGYGTGAIDLLVIATNERVATLGNTAAAPPGARPACTLLAEDDVRRLVGVGIVGRSDDRLRQIMLRTQVR